MPPQKPTTITNALLNTYLSIMKDIKYRVEAMRNIYELAIKEKRVDPQASLDFTYLQVRMICELIAVGCIAMHNDLDKIKRAHGKYQPKQILKTLDELHPDFYPIPTTDPVRNEQGHYLFNDLPSGYLTKDELPKVWATCNDKLHIGSFKHFLSQDTGPVNFTQAGEFMRKIKRLLSNHRIPLFGQKSNILWIMNKEKKAPTYIDIWPLASK